VLGTSVGPYQVLEKLGSGGMGEVFLCHDTRLHRKVALKCLTSGEPDEAQAGILREARAVARLTHPHIAGVYDVLEHEGRAFIVMEYVEGESLRSRLQRNVLSADETIKIGRQLASALAAAHRHGVIHRDLKPSNVQLTPDGTVKVLDFGIAKMMPRLELSEDPTTTNLPSHARSDTPGTPAYMAPEQLVGGFVDVRSDIYSLGVMLFEMATGRRPYAETNAAALAVAMSTSPPPPPDAIDPRVPRRLSSVIVKALQREPFNRYQTADELGAALDELIEPTTREVVEVAQHRPRRVWTLVVLAAALAIVVVTVLRPLLTAGIGRRSPSGPASVLAVLPVDNPTHDTQGEQFGVAVAAIVVGNLGSTSGLTVLSRASTSPYANRPDGVDALGRDLGAQYVLDLTVKSPPPRPEVIARLRRPGSAVPLWEDTLSGDMFGIEATLLDRVARVLERVGAWPRRLTDGDWARIRRLPTSSAEALTAYSQARASLDRARSAADAAQATALLERAIGLDPAFALAHAALADAYLEQYRAGRDPALAAKANDTALQALRINPDEASGYYALGNVQWATGRYEAAVSSLRRSLDLRPDNDDAHRLLANVLADRGDLDGAIAALQQALKIRPTYWRTYTALGRISYLAGNLPAALDAYRRASELEPNDPGPWTGLGLIYQVRGDLAEAIGNYEHAVRLGPSATAYSNLGVVYYSAGRYQDAIAAWQQALSINPKSMLYHRNIGDAHRRLKQTDSARAAYVNAIAIGEDLLKVNRRDAETIAHVAVCEAKVGRSTAASSHAAEALVLAPTNRVVLQRAAEVHALLGHADEALKQLQAAIEHGYGRRQARENDEFAGIRNLPKFQALVMSASGSKER